ncbi:hypothetical protein LCGC14_1837310, partial [marine sediment metagenome]
MTLHPFTEALLQKLADQPAISDGSPQDARALVAAARPLLGAAAPMVSVRDIAIAGRHGPVPIRVFRPTESPEGTMLYLHGGGWVVGALDDYDVYARALASRSNCTVLLVDYRLAPEHRFPVGLEDCEDALAAVSGRMIADLPQGPVIVAGDSAGGNLAAVLCRRLKDRGEVAALALYYPVTDHTQSSASYRAYAEGYPLSARDMGWFFDHYAGSQDRAGPDVSVLHASDLAGMPST